MKSNQQIIIHQYNSPMTSWSSYSVSKVGKRAILIGRGLSWSAMMEIAREQKDKGYQIVAHFEFDRSGERFVL